MNLERTKINDVIVIKPRVFEDERGYFFENYNSKISEKYNFGN